jgi:hypothetical protein
MTSAPTPDDVSSVPEDQTAPNEVGAVSASETTLVVKEVHRGLAHDPDRFVLEQSSLMCSSPPRSRLHRHRWDQICVRIYQALSRRLGRMR